MNKLKRGDKVEWNTPQGATHGTVVRAIRGTAKVEGHTAHASPQEPQWEVVSDKTGKSAIHKPAALKKLV
ncbi:MAG: DUF2945 domain-containing protein [Rubrivivax sp.]|nr:DUF2945 domain-containing protein [Rubrivivax sp.]